ncbi:uncharacterized protein PAC_10701 [Phialocephala subalpina]|uniref:HTH La-type RNA-binding domain-containing protein n=1 Tax=Phialocephala subalpina TaxID=576137 RepID=A0A1L7X705_9HELO|nr:uncharacterized protein PAC_10701 [Phialocephala subalpina]
MSTPQARLNGESTPAPPVFSYAMAAKGCGTPATASATQSQQSGASGISTPIKDTNSAVNTPSGGSERGDRSVNGSLDLPAKPEQVVGEASVQDVKATTSTNSISTPASPSFGSASTATLPREEKVDDDDFVLVGPPESSRDRNSQNGSASVEKPAEHGEGRRSKKGKKQKNAEKDAEKEKEKEKEKEEVKQEVLVPAPLPAVNFWAQRSQELAKTKPMPPPSHSSQLSLELSNSSSTQGTKSTDSRKRGKAGGQEEGDKSMSQNGTSSRGQKKGAEGSGKAKEDQSSKRAGPRGSRAVEKEDKSSQLPPPVDDAISWPTPDTTLEEDKHKPQDRIPKEGNDDGNQNKPRQRWVPVPFVPSVAFNTPIPTRGGRGRGGARGGRTEGGRPREAAGGSSSGDKVQTFSTDEVNPPIEGEKHSNGSHRAASLPPPKRQQSDQASTRKPTVVQSMEKPKASNSRNESNAMAEIRNPSAVPQFDQALENGQDQKLPHNEASRSSKQEQSQSIYQESYSRGDRRSEMSSRGMDSFREGGNTNNDNGQQSSRDRSDGRSDRGRGGYRGRGGHGNFPNGQPQHSFIPNSHGPPNGYPPRQNSAPYSPPLQQAPFSNQYAPPSQRGRGGSRSQSIPNNAMYGRFPNGGPLSQHMAPLQTSNPIFDYPHLQSLSATPYNSYVDEASLVQLVTMQLEYYFSIDNLCKDVYLRKHMDSQGFVFLSFIAGFKRIKALTTNFELLRYACQESDIIEVIQGAEDGKDRLRRAEGWEKWIMTMEDRDESVRNAGPSQHVRPHSVPRLHQMGPMMMQGHHAMSPLTFSPNGAPPTFTPYGNGMPVAPTMNGNGAFHPETPLSAAVAEFSPSPFPINSTSDPLEAETTFYDDEVANLTLVFARPKSNDDPKPKLPFHNSSSRTFSNGSIDGRSIAEELHDDSRQGRPLTNGSTHASETSPESFRRSRSPFTPLSPTKTSNNGPPVMWVKGQRQQAVVSEHNSEELYTSFRARTLKNRDASLPGETHPDMSLLYEFWSHFLCRNFNAHMYSEFREYALQDSQNNAISGVKNLISYYDEILNSKKKVIPEILARHYVELVQQEDPAGERPAFERLRVAWRNGALDIKSRKQIGNLVDAKLREDLDRVPPRRKSDTP